MREASRARQAHFRRFWLARFSLIGSKSGGWPFHVVVAADRQGFIPRKRSLRRSWFMPVCLTARGELRAERSRLAASPGATAQLFAEGISLRGLGHQIATPYARSLPGRSGERRGGCAA